MMVFITYWIYISYADTKTLFSFIITTTSNYERSAEPSFIKLLWRNHERIRREFSLPG